VTAPDLATIRRRTSVAVNLLMGVVALGAVGGAVAWCDGSRRGARKDMRAIWSLHTLRDAQWRFVELDPDRDGRADFGTLGELDRAGLLDDKLRGCLYGADHCYEVILHPTEPTRWLAIAHPLPYGVQAYALTDGPAVSASDEDIVGTTDCVIPPGCWQLGK